MRNHLTTLLFFVTATTWMVNGSAADEPPTEVNERFTQAANRTFKAFDPEREQAWQRPFFFMQLADTQYGMFTGNKGFEQEASLAQRAKTSSTVWPCNSRLIAICAITAIGLSKTNF